jgi:hypothetical protein
MNLGGDVLPQYRHETPKTSPHSQAKRGEGKQWGFLKMMIFSSVILHYSTSKTGG